MTFEGGEETYLPSDLEPELSGELWLSKQCPDQRKDNVNCTVHFFVEGPLPTKDELNKPNGQH